MGLIIRSSSIHAAGCYTTVDLAKGTRIVEYTGKRITKEAADEKYRDSYLTYLFGLGDGSFVIDGHCAAMFINHSCDANCETEEIEGRVWITAITDIPAGAELVYDYNLYDGGDDEALCNCGSDSCRRTMYSPEELGRRKRLARVKAKRSKAAKKRFKARKKAAEQVLLASETASKTASKKIAAGSHASPVISVSPLMPISPAVEDISLQPAQVNSNGVDHLNHLIHPLYRADEPPSMGESTASMAGPFAEVHEHPQAK